jgi:excisionase family DNA binding protein
MYKNTTGIPHTKNTITMSHMLSVADVATILGVSRQTVYTYIYTESLPSITVGRIRRIHPDSLNKWILEREKTYG